MDSTTQNKITSLIGNAREVIGLCASLEIEVKELENKKARLADELVKFQKEHGEFKSFAEQYKDEFTKSKASAHAEFEKKRKDADAFLVMANGTADRLKLQEDALVKKHEQLDGKIKEAEESKREYEAKLAKIKEMARAV